MRAIFTSVIPKTIFTWFEAMSGGFSIPVAVVALMKNSSEARALGVTALIGLLAAFISLSIRHYASLEKMKPKLKISGTTQSENIREGKRINWFLLKVETETSAHIEDCKGYVTKVEKEDVILWDGPPHQMPFTKSYEPDAFSKTIRDKPGELLDILAVAETGGIGFATPDFTWPYPTQPGDIFKQHGEYVISITITGRDTKSIEPRLYFDWTGNWKTSKLSLAKNPTPPSQVPNTGGTLLPAT